MNTVAGISHVSNNTVHQNQNISIQGETSYLDLGLMSAKLWKFMSWWPEKKLDMDQLNQYLSSLFSQLKKAGVNQINLSFGQLGSIDSLLKQGEGAPSDDVLSGLLKDFPGALEAIVQKAHANGMKVAVSFGGELGQSLKIVGSGETAAGQAQKLMEFMNKNGIDSVDFDIESPLFPQANSPKDARDFFTALHENLAKEGKTMTLTVEGSFNDWAKNYLKDLFYDDRGNPMFTKLFDGLNLMLYSETAYYVDAKNPAWGVEQWLDIIGKENESKVHIGFEDNVNYADPSTSAGGHYKIDTTDSGKAAAEIYEQLSHQLEEDGCKAPLGKPFFWPDTHHGNDRYNPIPKDGTITVNFDTDFMQSFYNELRG